MQYDVKDTKRNREITTIYALTSSANQKLIVRNRNLYLIDGAYIKKTDFVVNTLSQINWV